MACAMVYWGDNYQRFYNIFIQYGAVVNIANLFGESIGIERSHLNLFNTL